MDNGLIDVLIDEPLPARLQQLIDESGKYRLHTWKDEDEFRDAIFPIAKVVLIYSHFKIDGPMMDQMTNLKGIVNFGRGTDHIKHEDAKERRIPVANLPPGVLSKTVADMAFALILGTARNIVQCHRHATGPDFTHYDPNILLGHDVFEKTLGIVGLGDIGSQVAKRGRFGFDMEILYHNRKQHPQAAENFDAKYVSLNELCKRSDFLIVCLPINDSTRDIIGANELARMKAESFLINVGRGATVNHDALFEALSQNWIAGAAFDVTAPEPLPRGHRLLGLENFLVLPHLGSGTIENRNRMAEIAFQNLEACFGRGQFANRVV